MHITKHNSYTKSIIVLFVNATVEGWAKSFCREPQRRSHLYADSEQLVYMQMYASHSRRRICSGRSRSSWRRRISS